MDLPSDSDESDVDFVPDCEEAASEAESEDADKETEAQYEEEVTKRNLKRASTQPSRSRKKSKASNDDKSKEKSVPEKPADPESDKKYEEDLWASFLGTPAQSKVSVDKKETVIKEDRVLSRVDTVTDKIKLGPDIETKRCDDLFKPNTSETGNQLVKSVPRAEIKGKTISSSSPVPVPSLPGARKSGGGLASVLNKIGKKDKLSTLEKTKLDWMSFKKEEGIEEDISIHNRGRDGYLDRQDFLQRTDLNQFEIEKNLRTNKRSNR